MSWVDNSFFAPESLLDDKGRRILWAWTFDRPGFKTRMDYGSGTTSLPRVLSLAEAGTLRIDVPQELERLRYNGTNRARSRRMARCRAVGAHESNVKYSCHRVWFIVLYPRPAKESIMTPQQRYAWFNLVVFAVSLGAYLVLVPWVGVSKAWGAFGLFGLCGFGVLFYRKKPGHPVMDERDQQIGRRSVLLAYSVFWLFFVGRVHGALGRESPPW